MMTVQPTPDAREVFACSFYRRLAPIDENFMISPAAVMKVLLVLSEGADEILADEILWDLSIKHVNSDAIMAVRELFGPNNLGAGMDAIQDLIDEMNYPIAQNDLLEYFKHDFRELGSDTVKVKNYFVNKAKLTFQEDFLAFAKSYFNFNLLRKEEVETKKHLIDLRFSDCLTDSDLDIFGLVEFNFNCKPPFEMYPDGSLGAYGNFKYAVLAVGIGFDFCAEVVEVPLESQKNVKLTMLVFLPSDLATLTKRSLGYDYTDFNEIACKMLRKVVDIKLPNINLQKKYNLTEHFAEEYQYGLRDCFNEPVCLSRMFKNSDESVVEIGKYCQHTSLTLAAPKTKKKATDNTDKATDITFDLRDKSFFYVIKSEKVLYVMGHFYKEEQEPVKEEMRKSLRSSIIYQRNMDQQLDQQLHQNERMNLRESIRSNRRSGSSREAAKADQRNSLRESLKFESQKKNKKPEESMQGENGADEINSENMKSKKKDKGSEKDDERNSLRDSLKFESQKKPKKPVESVDEKNTADKDIENKKEVADSEDEKESISIKSSETKQKNSENSKYKSEHDKKVKESGKEPEGESEENGAESEENVAESEENVAESEENAVESEENTAESKQNKESTKKDTKKINKAKESTKMKKTNKKSKESDSEESESSE